MDMKAVFFLGLVLLTSCTGRQIIGNNEPPPDPTVSLVYRQSFINKAWLGLYGRYPTETEKTTALAVLDQNNCSLADRNQVVDYLMQSAEYRTYQLLNETNIALDYPSQWDFEYVRLWLNELANNSSNPAQQAVALLELADLDAFEAAMTAFEAGQITRQQLHKRLTNNQLFYWAAGSKGSWSERAFPLYLLRNSTEQEGYRCGDLISGFQSVLFGKVGSNMTDLLEIFFNSQEYFEGQIRIEFDRLLGRAPTAEELQTLLPIFAQHKDARLLQKHIVLLQEFLLG
jgi:hypothetical protein